MVVINRCGGRLSEGSVMAVVYAKVDVIIAFALPHNLAFLDDDETEGPVLDEVATETKAKLKSHQITYLAHSLRKLGIQVLDNALNTSLKLEFFPIGKVEADGIDDGEVNPLMAFLADFDGHISFGGLEVRIVRGVRTKYCHGC